MIEIANPQTNFDRLVDKSLTGTGIKLVFLDRQMLSKTLEYDDISCQKAFLECWGIVKAIFQQGCSAESTENVMKLTIPSGTFGCVKFFCIGAVMMDV